MKTDTRIAPEQRRCLNRPGLVRFEFAAAAASALLTPWISEAGFSAGPSVRVSPNDRFDMRWITGGFVGDGVEMRIETVVGDGVSLAVARGGGPPDSDGDGIDDSNDNCIFAANPLQLDADEDGIGNFCDGDFNNDCSVNFEDLGEMKALFFQEGYLEEDMNGDGAVNFVDLGRLKEVFFQPPGPSGIPNVCGHCTPGTVGCGWSEGDVISYSQLSWGEPSLPGAAEIVAHYDTLYAPSFGLIEIGIPGGAGFSIIFTSSGAILAYLPSTGPAAPLNADLLDPLSSGTGIFGGEVLGLKLNIDFADQGFTAGAAGVLFGDLTLCGLTGGLTGLNGTSVRSFAAIANTALGGGSTPFALADINHTAFDLNNSFSNGSVSLFAQGHLFNGVCPP